LPKGNIDKKIFKTNKGFSIRLKSKVLQKELFLFTKEKGHFSDNFFDLMPNETKVITFTSESETLSDLKIKTLNTI
jgi:beta-mannosidase